MTANGHNGEPRAIAVLVIEDDTDSRELYEVLLDSLGWRVVTAGSGGAALGLITSSWIDCIVSDLSLPDGDGYDLLPALRARAGRRIPAVAISGFGHEDDIRRSAEAGFDVHMTKPIRVSDLREVVERLVS